MMEVPLCYVAATLVKELWNFKVPDFGKNAAESWMLEHLKRGEQEPQAENVTLSIEQQILYPLIRNEFRTSADILWKVARCGSPDVVWGWDQTHPPELRWIIFTLLDPPEAGLGHPGSGNLLAFSVMLVRTFQGALLEHATDLRRLGVELAKKYEGKMAELFARTKGWPEMVRFAWGKFRE
ncbi:unnamed protein product, partial [Symbiodinium pilosum]